MSDIKIQPSATGSATVTLTAPATSTARTVTLPDSTGTLIADNGSGKVGIGTSSPDGTAHIHTASAGSVTANTDSDDLVVENSGNGGISVLTPDASRSAIQFGHTSDNLQLQIRHDGATTLSQIISDDPVTFNVTDGSEAIRVTAGGITFNGDTAAANTLDDYEEGTWTPTLSGTTGGASGVNFDFRLGWYTKVGRQVTAAWVLGMSSWSSGPTGNAQIIGLPFNAMTSTNFNMSPVIGYSSRFNSDNAPRGGFIESGASVVRLLRSVDTSSRNNLNTNVTCSGLGGDEYIYGQVTYFTS